MSGEWPAEARKAVVAALEDNWERNGVSHYQGADAVLAALAPHVQPRTDDWEWGTRDDGGYITNVGDDEFTARTWVKDFPQETLIRRHAATEWEDVS